MSSLNSFIKHPVISILSYTFFVVSATWTALYFLLDQQKVDLYLAKITVLENEIQKLSTENERYLNWLMESPSSFPYLEEKIAQLESELQFASVSGVKVAESTLLKEKAPILDPSIEKQLSFQIKPNALEKEIRPDRAPASLPELETAPLPQPVKEKSVAAPKETKPAPQKPYSRTANFSKGQSISDPKTHITLSVSSIHANNTADGMLYIPGKGNTQLDSVLPGTTWEYTKDNVTYKITLEEVIWLNNTVKASIIEMQ